MDKIQSTVTSTRIRLARNVKNLPFPNRLSGEEGIYTLLAKVQKTCDALFPNKYYKIDGMDRYESESLVERHLISRNLQKSKYGGAFISESEDISVMVFEEDHLRIQSIMRGFNLENAYNAVAKIDSELKKNVEIAFDQKLGYLTACPTNLGAAMRASVMLFLPGLTKLGLIDNIIMKFQDLGMTIRGIYGEGSKAEGYVYQISNQASISLSETEILNKIKKYVMQIVDYETDAREKLKSSLGIDLQNDIMISYGILKYACKMSSQEFNQNLASVKLGVALGYLNLDMDKLNSLSVLTQPAMLCFLKKKELTPQQRDIYRAEIAKSMIG